ncbi:MAG: NAD(P)/FAD-dependent oxidoreductase [Syntrophaceae bacterium]|nr:NAD(P)/FAD-dependent oxidoreductase [Syntrophaceae bacterium]
MLETSVTKDYDIVIIGAGPAGSSAARAAAQRGVKVLLVDQKQHIGVPVQCAEFVPQWISRYIHFSSTCILQTVETMVTHLSDQTCHEMKSPGYMLDRSLFDKELSVSAILSEARISIGTKATGLISDGVIVERGTRKEHIKSKVIIGADGTHSSTARWIGLPPAKTIVALQYEMAIPNSQNHVDIFFHSDYEGGYAWFFPKGRTVNVGLGVVPSKTSHLSDLLNDFLKDLKEAKKISRVEILSRTGGSIPCEPRRQTLFGNILLVGDAAGHAHPITGAGILNAVIGGEIAGRIAAEAVARGDLRYLENYEIEWRETFGKTLSYGVSKREFLEKNWNKADVNFEDLIRKTWVGFKEYYKDRKRR